MMHSILWLSQIQFFASLGFMLLFLVVELGLAWLLFYFKVRAVMDGDPGWTLAYRFWVRVFALAFVLSFAASLPVLIQFGSLWPSLMDRIGDVAGPLIAAGILTTFIFKSCFLGAMLFGQRRLAPWWHTATVLMVALGVTLSSYWLIALLSWMQMPSGATLVDDHYVVISWVRVMFNPFMPWLFGLFALVSMLSAAFLMLGVVAAQTLRRPVDESGRLVFKTAAVVAVVAVLLQGLIAAGAGQVAATHQPARAAATVGYWHSGAAPDLALAIAPDPAGPAYRVVLPWKGAAARWLGHDAQGRPRGLDEFSGMTPPVGITFWSFRVAMIIGILMALVAGLTLWRARRVRFDPAGLSVGWRRVVVAMTFSGWFMLLAGLCHVLAGGSPYAVYGTITLSEIAGDTPVDILIGGLLAWLVVYALFIAGFIQLVQHIARYGVVPIARRRGRA